MASVHPEVQGRVDHDLEPVLLVAWTEGPAVRGDGTLFFSDILNDRIMTLAPGGAPAVFRLPAGRANGNLFDAAGHLLTCEGAEFGPGGGRRLVRTDLDRGSVTVLTDTFGGVRYNSPNDLALDRRGRIYFTDPAYTPFAGRDLGREAVYRLDPDGRVQRILDQPDIEKPNGIAVSPDDRTLYLVDSNPSAGGNRKIWAYDLDGQGTPRSARGLWDFAPGRGGDGMRVDVEGNVWVAAGLNVLGQRPRQGPPPVTLDVPAGIYVISPQGRLLERIPVPYDPVTNLAFGGADGRTLYVTAGGTIWRTTTRVAGYVAGTSA